MVHQITTNFYYYQWIKPSHTKVIHLLNIFNLNQSHHQHWILIFLFIFKFEFQHNKSGIIFIILSQQNKNTVRHNISLIENNSKTLSYINFKTVLSYLLDPHTVHFIFLLHLQILNSYKIHFNHTLLTHTKTKSFCLYPEFRFCKCGEVWR